MKMLVILQGPAYGDERAYNGLRLAGNLAKREGVEVKVFCFGDAVFKDCRVMSITVAVMAMATKTTAPIRASTLPSIKAPFPALQLVLNIRPLPGW